MRISDWSSDVCSSDLHAGRDYLGGYCHLNTAAIAAQAAIDGGMARVAILDVDYHHGNGTQDIFWNRGDVFFASLHADPATDYPFYRSEEHTSELQSLMRISYAVFRLKKKTHNK